MCGTLPDNDLIPKVPAGRGVEPAPGYSVALRPPPTNRTLAAVNKTLTAEASKKLLTSAFFSLRASPKAPVFKASSQSHWQLKLSS